MLEKLGFKYKDTIDPFDGGPHLEAATDKIPIVRETRTGELGSATASPSGRAFVSQLDPEGNFRAVDSLVSVDARGRIQLPKATLSELGWSAGQSVGFTMLDDDSPKPGAQSSRGKKVKA